MRERKGGVFLFFLNCSHPQMIISRWQGHAVAGLQSDCSLSYQRHRFPLCLNGLSTILCHILQRSKGLLNCDEIINQLTKKMQRLPPKESICQQSCVTVSLSLRAGIHFPMTLYDFHQPDFHLIVTALLIRSYDTT